MVLIPWFHVSSAGLFTSQDGHDGRLKDPGPQSASSSSKAKELSLSNLALL